MTEKMVAAFTENASISENKAIPPVMEKSNEATPQQPAGDRLLDAESIEMNLNIAKRQIREESAWINSDRKAITLFKTADLRIVLIALHEGAELKTHTAPGLISVQVLEGGITFRTEKHTSELDNGEMLTLHAGIPHSVFARKESIFLLTLTTVSS